MRSPRPHAVAWLVFAGLRLGSLGRGWHLDEFATLEVLRAPSFADAMHLVRKDPHHPGFFALLYGWHQLGGHRVWLRALPLLFELATLGLFTRALAQAGREGAGASAGAGTPEPQARGAAERGAEFARGLSLFVALGLWGANPLALRFATELRPYSALMCTTLLTFLAVRQHLWTTQQKTVGHNGWVFVAATATVAMHPVGFFAVVAIFGAAFLYAPRRASLLAPAAVATTAAFVALHFGFTLDPHAARISWMPAMSLDLFGRIVSVCFGLEDSLQYGALSRALYFGGVSGIVLMAVLALWARRAPVATRPATLAALLMVAMVSGYSVVAQPIFWYRALAPAIVLLVFGASAGVYAAARRPATAAFAALVLWQMWIYLPLASRAVDPAEEASALALQLRGQTGALYVFPGWMQTCVDALQDGQRGGDSALATLPLDPADAGAVPVAGGRLHGATFSQDAAATGVALIRCNLDLFPGPGGLAQALDKFRHSGRSLRHLVVIHDDNDDLSEPGQQRRRRLLAAIVAIMPSCRVASSDVGRIAHLDCTAAQAAD